MQTVMRGNGGEEGTEQEGPRARGIKIVVAAGLLLVLIGLASKSTGWVVDWLWMGEVGYKQIFMRLLSIRLLLFALTAIPVFAYFWVNLRIATRHRSVSIVDLRMSSTDVYEFRASPRGLSISVFAFSLIPALIFGLVLSAEWDSFIRYFWGGSFGLKDPVFGADIAFYVFRLPFIETIQGALTVLAFLALPITFVGYLLTNQVTLKPAVPMNRRMFRHLSILFVLFLAAWGSGYYLDIFALLNQKRGAVYGAGYTDYHVARIGLWIMMAGSVALAILVLTNLRRMRLRIVVAGAGAYVALMIVFLGIVPALVQSYVVLPNELSLETPYLQHNIAFTRQAYQLDKVEERAFSAGSDLSMAALSRNEDTLKNVRLWDWNPVLQTFKQTQEMRLYYRFHQVDVDRYHLPGEGYRQVMVSGRELSEQVVQQARTWVNEYLEFTHGYGLAMCYVSETAEGGLPRMAVKNIPPESSVLKIDQPAMYYGENMPGYSIVKTGVEEFDYPKGDQNVYTKYHGTGGIPVGSFWRKLLFSWQLFDSNLLISSYIKPESRILLFRSVRERVGHIAPFLALDPDPYLVVSEGKLFWVQDGYTTSSRYPYSDPYSTSVNYVRNSVKAVVDAYDGSVSFYVSDPNDPILAAYSSAFPGSFKPLTSMPEDLKAHIRYPEDLFRIQTDRFTTYHMTEPRVFYNKEDVWALPSQKTGNSTAEMEPYYALIRMPGEKELRFLLMLPMTPLRKANMVAWIAAACDFPDYGKLLVYQLSKDRLIYGPMQIEAMIDQEPTISQQLSLWDQKGSRVIRGNLLVIPIEDSFLYVEPVYLIAEEVNIPQLIRVIVAYGSKVSMQASLEDAIRAVFGNIPASTPSVTAPAKTTEDALGRVRKEFQQAEDALKRGQWAEFGRAMEALKALIGK